LVNEAHTLYQLSNDNIVKIYDLFEENNTLYIVMQYIDGTDLEQLVTQQGKIPYQKLLHYARQIAEGISYIHKKNIVHYDIKPGNILIDNDDHVKIIDFGFSKRYNQRGIIEESRLVSVESGMYSAPEILEPAGRIKFNPCADIYSLGMTLYYAISGKKVQTGATRATMDHDEAKLHLENSAYRNFQVLLNKCCNIKVRERYQSTEEFLSALSAIDKTPVTPKNDPPPAKRVKLPLEKNKKGHIVFYLAALVLAICFVWYLYGTGKIFAGSRTKLIETLPTDELTNQRKEKLDSGVKIFKEDVLNSITSKADSERIELIVQSLNKEEKIVLTNEDFERMNAYAGKLPPELCSHPLITTLYDNVLKAEINDPQKNEIRKKFIKKYEEICIKSK
jgi:serine/threonine protein kinase